MKTRDFIHPDMDEEIKTISGRYAFNREERIPFKDGEVLYLAGYSVTDSSCCGTGGCFFCLVTGFVSRWRYKVTADGKAVSEVQSIHDDAYKNELKGIITDRERCTQVNFL